MLNKSVSSFRRSVTTLLTAAMTQRNKRMKFSSLHSIPPVLSLLTSYNRLTMIVMFEYEESQCY